MITDFQEEQACLYVLGLLPPEESLAFEIELGQLPSLAQLTASLNNATLSLAHALPPVALPASARQRLLTAMSKPPQTTIPFRPQSRLAIFPWAAAACLIGLLLWKTTTDQVRHTTLTTEITQRKAAAETAKLEFQALTQRLAISEAARVELIAKISLLEKKDFIAQAQIAVLGSLIKDRPQALAVSLWDQEKQNGLLVVENLPVLDPGKDYQLWVLDPSNPAPVSAGVFKVDAQGKVRITFKPNQTIQTAAKFAVTQETEGGVASPTMDQMVVIGGI